MLRYWFTENDPEVSPDKHGVWVKTNLGNAKRLFEGKILRGHLVFIYETRYDRDHVIKDGRSKVVALVRVENVPFKAGKWILVAKTKWLAGLDCPDSAAHAITGRKNFRKIGHFNVLELDPTQACRLLQYCKSRPTRDHLMDLYFPDDDDAEQQKGIQEAPPAARHPGPREPKFTKTKGGKKLQTDPGIAKTSLMLAGYRCELNPSHETFQSSVTGKNYVEAHHLIPLRAQGDFGDCSLDHEANIICLCPNCHRLMHHAVSLQKGPPLNRLFEMRKRDLERAGISLENEVLVEYYP